MLGDRIESFLKGIGVTPKNYGYAKEVLKLGPCNCGETKQWFNKIHIYAKKHGWPRAIIHANKLKKELRDAKQSNQ